MNSTARKLPGARYPFHKPLYQSYGVLLRQGSVRAQAGKYLHPRHLQTSVFGRVWPTGRTKHPCFEPSQIHTGSNTYDWTSWKASKHRSTGVMQCLHSYIISVQTAMLSNALKCVPLLILISILSCHRIDKGLVVHYPFDLWVDDHTQTQLHGRCEGAWHLLNVGTRRGTFLFSGRNDMLIIPHHPLFSEMEEVSLSLWVRPLSGSETSSTIIDKLDMQTGQGFSLNMHITDSIAANEEAHIGLTLAVAPNCNAQVQVILDEWSHLVISYAKGQLQIYVNGSLAENAGPHCPVFISGHGDLYIGNSMVVRSSVSNAAFRGEIDDVRIYDRKLSRKEIAKLVSL